MTEHEMQNEIERLRRELAEVTKSRDRMRVWLCQSLGFETDPDALEQELKEMETQSVREIGDLLRDILPASVHDRINDDSTELNRTNVPANA